MRFLRRWPFAWLAAWFGGAGLLILCAPGRYRAGSALFLARSLDPPRWGHFLGFDPLGRDLQWVIFGASLRSAGLAAITVAIASALALLAGTTIALLPARSKTLALRALDGVLAFPFLLLALAWAAIRGPGWGTLSVALLLALAPAFTRLVYARASEIVREPFVEASHGLGAGSGRILTRHLLPALGSTCAVKIPVLFAQALMAEATLSFLGVGAPIGTATWGALLATGKDYLFEAPHIAIGAGIPLTLTVLALQLIGERRAEKPWLSARKSVS